MNNNRTGAYLLTASAILASTYGQASLLDFQGSYFSELEERSAVANQRVYDELKAQGCQDTDQTFTETCAGTTFLVWRNVRELVHTANDLSNNGEPTQFSLNLPLFGLGFALRWTAGEEFSTEESMSNSFVTGQLSGLTSRISALRSGAQGFNLVGIPNNGDSNRDVASSRIQSGVNAGDETGGGWSQWGGFLNGSYTYGDQGATEREDAFAFDGQEINGGIDYRIDNNWVIGAVIGYQEQEIDFNSRQSIVDGTVEMSAYSIMPFVLYQSDQWYFSGSAGIQQADFDTNRSIQYPSLDPDGDNADTVARSSNEAQTFSASLTAGYSFFITPAFTVEPSIGVNYQDVNIEEYSEVDLQNDGFNFFVDEQNFDSLETVASLKVQYVVSSQIGVFIPYVDLGFYGQQETDARFINATYGDAVDQLSDNARFSLPTDSTDSDYKIYTIGISSVIRGASQKNFGEAATGGIQVFVNYREIKDIGNYQQKIIAGGLRYEF